MVRRLIALTLVVPPLWGAVWTSRDVAADLLSRSPELSGGPQNIAEAAGLGDGAEVLRMLRRGDNLHGVLPLRPETISSSVLLATVLEAAVWGRRIELVRLLQKEGAFVGEDPTHIGCLAQDLRADDIAEYLAAGETCVPDAALESVLKRTREAPAPQ